MYSFRIIELTVRGIWNKRKRCRKKAHQCYARTPSPPKPKPVYKELSCLNIAQSAFCSNLVPLYCLSDFMWPSTPTLSPTPVLLEYVTWNHSLESRTRLRTSAVPIKAVCSSLFADHEAAVGAAVSPSHDEVDVALDLGADGPLAKPLVRPVVNGLAAPVYAALAVVRFLKVDMPQRPPSSNLGSFFFFFSTSAFLFSYSSFFYLASSTFLFPPPRCRSLDICPRRRAPTCPQSGSRQNMRSCIAAAAPRRLPSWAPMRRSGCRQGPCTPSWWSGRGFGCRTGWLLRARQILVRDDGRKRMKQRKQKNT